MSFSKHLFIGASIGTGAGFVSAAYFLGLTEKAEKRDSLGGVAGGIILTTGSILACPVVGTAGGAFVFGAKRGIKHFKTASRPVQLTVGIIATTVFVTAVAYKLGKKD